MPRSAFGRIEDEMAKAFVAFEKQHTGRGPKEASCHVVGDLLVVRLTGALTPAETHLSKSAEGVDIVKRMRTSLAEGARDSACAVVQEATGRRVVSMHTDLSTQTGERVFLFTLDGPPEPQG